MEQNTNPTPQQPPKNEGFDINKIPKANLIHAGIAAAGAIGVILPWYIARRGGSDGLNGFHPWFGYLVFIAFLLIVFMDIFYLSLNMEEKVKKQILKFSGYAVMALMIYTLINFETSGFDYKRATVTSNIAARGIGMYLSLVAALVIQLIDNKVIKLK